jgi:ADP-ribosyl-[dinitrogen reductase] hydrolase
MSTRSDDPTSSLSLLLRLEGEGVARGRVAEGMRGRDPDPWPKPWSRVEGMLLGLAIGDALGNTTEGQVPGERHGARGEIRDYLPNRHAAGAAVGLPSDDSQLAFWTIEQLLEDGGYVPERLADRFCRDPIFGIGRTVRAFVHSRRDLGLPWYEAGQRSAGNGALMRIAPMLLPHLRRPSPDLWADTALSTLTTHNDSLAMSSSVAFMTLLWSLLAADDVPDAGWLVDTFEQAMARCEDETPYPARGGRFAGWSGRPSTFVATRVRDALARNLSVREACDEWHSAAYLLETVPSVLYVLARHAGDPEQAIVRAVNDTWDNDTVAATVGAAVGALHGADALPARWRRGLLGRTRANDDGRVFELILQARDRFGVPDAHGRADLRARMEGLLQFLPAIEESGFVFGQFHMSPPDQPELSFGWEYGEVGTRLADAVYRFGWWMPFDWSTWEEGRRLVEDPARLSGAGLTTLRKLLTMHVRADRFADGHLAAVHRSGHLAAILRRVAELRAATVS